MQAVIVDVGMGNLRSVGEAFRRAGATVQITGDPDRIRSADRVVFPGQGTFGRFCEALRAGVGDAIVEFLKTGRPYFGICLGMQTLFERSEEAPEGRGLGVLQGSVKRLHPGQSESGEALKVPHMGWNRVKANHPWLPPEAWYYFVHSYFVAPSDERDVAATTEYGQPFCSAIAHENIFGCQFHPEKSQHAGERLIEKFLC